jgi:PPM family protein phosphatase
MTGRALLQLASACQSHTGLVRGNNEDLAIHEPGRGIFGVIDGVGGSTGGEHAAAIARRDILACLTRPADTPVDRIREAIAVANNEIVRAARERPDHAGMSCVLTVALVCERTLTIAHIGDSRCYKIRPGQIRKLTMDHSPVGQQEDAGELPELEAMSHPRRNEVFRDVGSAEHQADDDGFIDIVEDVIEDDCAILLCTDGLTDGVASWILYELIEQDAGDPDAVANALVAAANQAGGRDNVTVVYLEAPGFAAAVGQRRTRRMLDDDPELTPPVAPAEDAIPPDEAAITAPLDDAITAPMDDAIGRSLAWGAVRWIAERRVTWLALGLVLGVLGASLIVTRIDTAAGQPRQLLVGGTGPGTIPTIRQAMEMARPGDVVVVQTGTYREQVTVKDAVDLVAASPGRAVLAGSGAERWTAITALGTGRISGLRVLSTAEAPIATGVRVSGADRRLELLDFDGPMEVAIRIENAQRSFVHGCTVTTSRGAAVALVSTADVRLMKNTFVNKEAAAGAVWTEDTTGTEITRNTFVGYGPRLIEAMPRPPGASRVPSADDALTLATRDVFQDNVVVPAVTASPRRGGSVR